MTADSVSTCKNSPWATTSAPKVHMLDFGEENRNEEKGPAHLLDKFGVDPHASGPRGKIETRSTPSSVRDRRRGRWMLPISSSRPWREA